MDNITEESMELLKGALAHPNDELAKTISTATGLLAYDLQAPSKNLYPFLTPIRNIMPRVGGGTGAATNWRQVNAISGSGFDSMGWVPEGQRSGQMTYNTSNRSATYVTLGEEDAATFEAISAGRQFEDIQARMTMRLLQKMMLKEEMAVLAGNASMPLGTPATPTVSAVALASSTLTSATYLVKVVALTAEGFANSGRGTTVTLPNTSPIIVPTTRTVTSAGSSATYVVSGGSSNISAESAGQATVSGTSALGMTVAPIQGAVAYAWFIGVGAGNETLQAITTINSYVQSVPLSTGNQAQTTVTADNSANSAYAYDGLMTTAFKSGNSAYVNYLPTGTVGTGTVLTASGRGSINEIDTMFQAMWDLYQLSPTVLYCNSQELKNMTTKVLSSTSAPLLRYDSPASGSAGEYQITASGVIQFYYNPFAIDGGLRIPVRIHPKSAAGDDNIVVRKSAHSVPV